MILHAQTQPPGRTLRNSRGALQFYGRDAKGVGGASVQGAPYQLMLRIESAS